MNELDFALQQAGAGDVDVVEQARTRSATQQRQVTSDDLSALQEAFTLPDDASDDAKAHAAGTISRVYFGQENYDGSIWTGGKPLKPAEHLSMMRDFVRGVAQPPNLKDLADFEALPDDEARFKEAQKKLGPFRRFREGVADLATSDFAPLAQAEEAGSPENVRAANAILSAYDPRRPDRPAKPPVETGTPEYRKAAETVAAYREQLQKKNAVSEYRAKLYAQNAWLQYDGARASLTKDADDVVREAFAMNRLTPGMVEKFKTLPGDQQRLVAGLVHSAKHQGERRLAYDAGRTFVQMAVDVPVKAAQSYVVDAARRAFMDDEEYQRFAETRATLAQMEAPRMAEYGYVGQSVIGFAGTIPYMAAAMIPYAGTAMIAGQAAYDFEQRVAAEGGDVTSAKFQGAKWAMAVAYASVEKLQANRIAKPLTDLEKRQALCQFWRRANAPIAASILAGDTAFETAQEGIQKGIEDGFVAWGLGKDVAAAAAAGTVQEIKDTAGTMFLTSLAGAGGKSIHANVSKNHTLSEIAAGQYHASRLIEATAANDKEAVAKHRAALGSMQRAWRAAGTHENAVRMFTSRGVDPRAADALSRFFEWEYTSVMGDASLTADQKEALVGKDATLSGILQQLMPDATVGENSDGSLSVRRDLNGVRTTTRVQVGDMAKLDVASPEAAASISEALTAAGFKISPEEWLKMSESERRGMVTDYNLRQEGQFKLTAEPTSETEGEPAEVTGQQLSALSGQIDLNAAARPAAVFHEAFHAFVRYLRAAKIFTDADIARLREEFGAPRPGVNEDFNEESAAEAFRSYAAGKVQMVQSTALEKAWDSLWDVLDRFGSLFRRRDQVRTVRETLFQQLAAGTYTGIPVGTITEAQRQANAAKKAESARKRPAQKAQQAQEPSKAEKPPETTPAEKPPSGEPVEAIETAKRDIRVGNEGNEWLDGLDDDINRLLNSKSKAQYDARFQELLAAFPNITYRASGLLGQEWEKRHKSLPSDEEKAAAAAVEAAKGQKSDEPAAEQKLPGEHVAYTPKGNWKVTGELMAISFRDLVPSSSPEYEQDLQPRDRDTVASRMQIQDIRHDPHLYEIVGGSNTSSGYLWVNRKFRILSGNGRYAGFSLAIQDGILDPRKLDAYMREQARKEGIVVPDSISDTIVVAVVDEDALPPGLTMKQFVELSNQPNILLRSEAETAEADAKSILEKDLLKLFQPGADGNLLVSSNDAFIAALVRATGDASLVDSNGLPTDATEKRIRRALLAMLVGTGPDARAIVRGLVEDAKELGMKTELAGVMRAAADIVTVSRDKPQYGLLDEIGMALRAYMDMKREGSSPFQADLFGRPPAVDAIVKALWSRSSAGDIAALFSDYAARARLIDTSTAGLGLEKDPTKEELLEQAIAATGTGETAEQAQKKKAAAAQAEEPPAPTPPPTQADKAKDKKGSVPVTPAVEMQNAIDAGTIPAAIIHDPTPDAPAMDGDGQQTLFDEMRYWRETPTLPVSENPAYRGSNGKINPDIASEMLPYPLAGNKSHIFAHHADFFATLARNSTAVWDLFGGAATYIYNLAEMGALPAGSRWNEWEYTRYVTTNQIKSNPAGVTKAMDDLSARLQNDIPPGDRKGDDINAVRQQILDWLNAELRGEHGASYVVREDDGQGRVELANTPEMAALYLLVQNISYSARSQDVSMVDGKPTWTTAGSDEKAHPTDAKVLTLVDSTGKWNPGRRLTRYKEMIAEASKRLENVDVSQGDGWEAVKDAPAGALVFIDSSYFGAMNYGLKTREDGDVAKWLEKAKERLASRKDLTYVITNNWNFHAVSELEKSGFLVARTERANDKPELVALDGLARRLVAAPIRSVDHVGQRLAEPGVQPGGTANPADGADQSTAGGTAAEGQGLPPDGGLPGPQAGPVADAPRLAVSANGRKALESGVYKDRAKQTLADLNRLPATLKPYVAKYDDPDDLTSLSMFAGWKPGPKVAPAHLQTYRPAVRLKSGEIAWHPRARMHAEALSMWLKQQGRDVETFDLDEYYGDGGIGPDGRYYEQPRIGDGPSDFAEAQEQARYSIKAQSRKPLDIEPTPETREAFGSWQQAVDSERPHRLKGYRGIASDLSPDAQGFGATEGEGIYIAKTEQLARFFGTPLRMDFDMPRNALIVDTRLTGLPALDEEHPMWQQIEQPVKDSDDDWLKAHKMAFQKTGQAKKWNPETFQSALTDEIVGMGYDSVLVRSGGDEWVVLFRDQNVTMPSRGGERYSFKASRPAPAFYSQLRRVIEQKVPNKATVAQIRATIDPAKGSGVKADEIFWSGLDEFLSSKKPTDIVTKEEVLAATREVVVRDVVKGAYRDSLYAELRRKYNIPENDTIADHAEELSPEDYAAWNVPEDSADHRAKFENYVLPGGENYRELLLTLPSPPVDKSRMRAEEVAPGRWQVSDGERFVGNDVSARSAEEAIQKAADRRADLMIEGFRSGHFSEPNIVAHVRFNERTSADGKRTLFIEEIQSDWAQKGREHGFGGSEAVEKKQMPNGTWVVFVGGNALFEYPEDQEVLADAIVSSYKRGERKSPEAVPGAPFVTKTDAWVSLALKRMVRWAAENGFEQIAWTTGEQQAERYDLSKQVDSIKVEYDKNQTPGYKIDAFKDGRSIDGLGVYTAEELPRVIGKDLADKIVKDERVQSGQVRTFKGQDLKVGGEGMKSFYDQIVPQTANKLFKRFGAKVAETKILVGENFTIKHTDLGWIVSQGGQFLGQYKTEGEAKASIENVGNPVHSLPITPEMRDSVLYDGQARFSFAATPPLQGTELYNAALDMAENNADSIGDSMKGTHAWLTQDGKWINVYAHMDIMPNDEPVSVDRMTKAGFVRVLWDGIEKLLYADYSQRTISRQQRKALEDAAIEYGGHVYWDNSDIRYGQLRHSFRATRPLQSGNSRAVASLAVQRLLGQELTTEKAARAAYLHQAEDATPDQLIAEANRLADSKVGEAMKQALASPDPTTAYRIGAANAELDAISAARAGVQTGLKMGISATKAEQTATKRLIRDAEAAQAQDFVVATGIDPVKVMLAVQPEVFAAREKEEEGPQPPEGPQQESGQKAEPPKATPEQMAERDRRKRNIVEQVRAWADQERARREKEADEAAKKNAEGAGEGAEAPQEEAPDEPGIPPELLTGEGADLRDANEMARALRLWIADWIVERSKGRLTHQTLWTDAEAVSQYKKTMTAILTDAAYKMVAPGDYALSTIQGMIDDLPSVAMPDTVERRSASVIAVIQANAIRQSRNELIAQIRKDIDAMALQGGPVDPMQEDLKRKINGEQQKTAAFVKRILSWSPKKIEAEREKIKAELEGRENLYRDSANGEEPLKVAIDAQYHHNLMKLQMLDRWGGIKGMLPAEIVEAGIEIRGWMKSAQERLYARWQDMAAQTGKLTADIARAVVPEDQNAPRPKDGWFDAFLGSHLATVRQRLEGLVRNAKDEPTRQAALAAIEELMFHLSRGSEIYATTINDYRKAWTDAVAEITGSRKAASQYLRHLDEPIPADVSAKVSRQGFAGTMTYGQAIQLYASIKQVGSYADNVRRHKRLDHADLIESILTPEDVKLVGRLRRIYEQRRAALSDVVRSVTGIPVWRPDPLYMPVQMLTGRPGGLGIVGTVRAWNPLADSLTPRRRNGLDFDESVSVQDMFMQRSEDAARAIAFGARGILIRGVLGDADFQNAVDRYVGKAKLTELLKQTTQAMAGLGRENADKASRVAAWLRRVNTYTALSGNMLSAAKQTVSFPVFAMTLDGGFREVVESVKAFDRQALAELMDSDGYRARYGGGISPEIAEAMLNPDANLVKRLYAAGMTVIQIGDMVASLSVATGIYKAKKAAYVDQGMDETAATERAKTMTWAMVEETQQSSRPENMPAFYRNQNEFLKLFLQFASAPALQLSHEFHAAADVQAGVPGAKGRLARAILINHFIVPALLDLMSAGFYWLLGRPPEDEDKELWRRIRDRVAWNFLIGPFSRMLIVGAVVDGVYNASVNGKLMTLNGMLPAESTLRTLSRLARTPYDTAVQDTEKLRDDLLKAIEGASAPARHAIMIYENRIAGE